MAAIRHVQLPLALPLVMVAGTAIAAEQKATEKKADPPKPTPTVISTEVADLIRQTVAKITALGEAGRLCTSALSNDQSHTRDIQGKIQELDTRMANLKQDMNRLYQTRAQRSQVDNFTEYNKLDNQGKAAQAQRNVLAAELQKIGADASNQQSCIDKAKDGITNIINDPSKALPPTKGR